MKKFLIISATALAILATSCSHDTPNSNSWGFRSLNIVAPADGSQAYATSAGYQFTFNLDDSKMKVAVTDMVIGGKNVSFISPEQNYKYYQFLNGEVYTSDINNFTSTSNGNYTISDMSLRAYTNFGYPSSAFPGIVSSPSIPGVVSMKYTIDGVADITTFAADSFYNGTTTSNTGAVMTLPQYRLVFTEDANGLTGKATMIIYNAQFDPKMPAIAMFALQNLDVEYTKDGFKVSGKDLGSTYWSAAEGQMENPAFAFDSFKMETTPGNTSEARIEFVVAGGRFSASAIVTNIPY